MISELESISCSYPKIKSFTRRKTIHDLSDENLEYIFAMLPLVDRVAVQTVCERWNTIIRKSWQTSASKKLELPSPNIDIETISYALFATGPHLTHIDFSQNASDIDDIILYSIQIYCKNVQYMDLSSMKLSSKGIKYLKINFKNITEFAFGSCQKNYNRHLSRLFVENNKMKSLKIESISSDLKFLIESPISETLEELILQDIDSDFSSFCQAADKYKNLEKLLIKDCDNITEEILETIPAKWKNIKHLQFSGNFNKINSLNNISFLKYLQILDISFNIFVDDILLKCIVDGCPDLYDVNISGCDSITIDGLKTVSTLPKLKILYVNYLNKIQEFHFNKMQHLETLSCCGCTNLTSGHISSFLIGSLKLRFLDVSYCKQITEDMISIIELFNEVRTSEMLEINIYNTGITIDKDIPHVKLIRRKEIKSRISIEILNNECLKHVFSYLPLEDRLRGIKVCKRWSDFNEEYFKKIKSLCPIALKQQFASLKVLNHILNRCTHQIFHVDFSVFGKILSCHYIKSILLKCHNLRSIVFPDGGLTLLMIAIFGKSNAKKLHNAYVNRNIRGFNFKHRRFDIGIFNNITSLTVGSSPTEALHILFLYFPKLEYFKIEGSKFTGESLLKLPRENLQSLIIKDCWDVYTRGFDLAILRFTHLKHLSIIGCKHNSDSDLTLPVRSLAITSLQISSNQPHIEFHQVPNLHSLDISNNKYLDDFELFTICDKHNKLKKLDISNCPKISRVGLKRLCSLKRLEHLSMNNLHNILDFEIEGLHKLKILEFRNCINLYNAGLFNLLNTSPVLEMLDLTNCERITHHVINHSISLLKSRGFSQVLEIRVRGTSVNRNEIMDCGPFNNVRIKF